MFNNLFIKNIRYIKNKTKLINPKIPKHKWRIKSLIAPISPDLSFRVILDGDTDEYEIDAISHFYDFKNV